MWWTDDHVPREQSYWRRSVPSADRSRTEELYLPSSSAHTAPRNTYTYTERETHTQRERDTHTHTQRERETHTHTHTERQYKHRERERERHTMLLINNKIKTCFVSYFLNQAFMAHLVWYRENMKLKRSKNMILQQMLIFIVLVM